ncbi:hypothetical protein Gocc_2793 [Gaiella occulta]|uniref:LarA-like N-terminal domain-containing protein n=1 Tax=Gaiella occulta TaxID=1002870 RepID=A0A7M2YVE1_9ACTN|nr:lactate racemase domain-containing protein [Gaiella occulta]RDI73437.1 hypothetical protein Gocc_2793 [Gaiella occulta]
MRKIPLLTGSRVQLVAVDDGAHLLAPPPPLGALADVGDAVAEALRYPLSGPPLADLVTRGGRATIVVELPTLPLPGAAADPRQDALAAVIDELDRLGMPRARHTLLVAGGLERRAGRRDLERLLHPARARAYRGTVVVHDCAGDELRSLGATGAGELRVHPALVDTDLVVTVTAAETTDRGGACTLLAACSADVVRAARPSPSLLQPSASPASRLGAAVESALAQHTPVVGVSLVLDHPRLTGRYRGYPWSLPTLHALRLSPARLLLNALPGGVRRHLLQGLSRQIGAVSALAGPPSVAHAEALLRGVAVRGTPLPEPLDTLVVPLPWKGPRQPREPLNPITAAAVGLGLALRLWRDAPPLAEGGTIVLLHDFARTFESGPQAPHRALFNELRENRDPERIAGLEAAAARDHRGLSAYRGGRAPHPLLPYADWETCAPALARAGRVIAAGCRDAAAARALGLVPSHNATTALQMARGVAGGDHRVGVLLAPPYAPLLAAALADGERQSMPR